MVRGSAGIYGSEPAAPQFFTEEMARLYPLRTRFQRDVAEIENYFDTFSRRHPRIVCTMLRYQPSVGPSLDSQITRYLSQPLVPTYMGFDPRLQFIHELDAIEALVAAIKNPVRGAGERGRVGDDRADPADPHGGQAVGCRCCRPSSDPWWTPRSVPASRHCRRTSGACCATGARSTPPASWRRWATSRGSARWTPSRDYIRAQRGRRLVPTLRDLVAR